MSRTLVIHHHHYPTPPPPPRPVVVYQEPEDTGPSVGAVVGFCFLAFLVAAAVSSASSE
jgi:hypothetical protein